jgi:hypothetical protein
VTLVTGVPDVGLDLTYLNKDDTVLTPAGGALSAGQRDCVWKVRITVQASLPNPDPTATMPLLSTAQVEVALRNRAQNNF